MNAIGNTSIVLLLCFTSAMAAPASESSLKQLLTVTQAQRLVDSMLAQADSYLNNTIQQALKGKTPTSKQQQAIAKMRKRMVAVMKNELAWDKLEPMVLLLYKETFTEEEVAGMLSFYKTPAGKAVINKMPVLMQRTMVQVQKIMSDTTPQTLRIEQDFLAEMKAASN